MGNELRYKTIREISYDDCYVAFLDLLGFKSMIFERGKDYILNIFDEIDKKAIRTSINFNSKDHGLLPLVPKELIHRKIMSDSIVIFIDKNIKNALDVVISICWVFQVEMLALPEPILVRGGISNGYMYYKDDILFGQGLTNAYLLESQCAKYPRIIIPRNLVDEYNNMDEMCNIYGMISDEKDGYYSVDYINLYLHINPKRDNMSWDILNDYIYKCLNKYFEPSLREKYLYLQEKLSKYNVNYNYYKMIN